MSRQIETLPAPVMRTASTPVSARLPAHLPTTRFGRADGLKSSQVHMAAFDARGEIWCASPLGLVHYNGIDWLTHGKRAGLRSHGLRCVVADADDTLWVGSDSGVEQVELTDEGVRSRGFHALGIVDAVSISARECLVGTPNGVFERRAGRFQRVADLRFANSAVAAMRPASMTGHWIAVAGARLGLARDGRWMRDIDLSHLGFGEILTLCVAKDGVTLGFERGWAHLGNDGTLVWSQATDAPVRALHDEDGDLWVALGTRLLRALGRKGRPPHLLDVALDGVVVRDIRPDTSGNIWVATDDDGLHRIDATRHVGGMRPGPATLCFADGPSGRLVGTAEGLTLSGETVLEAERVWDALELKPGEVWAAAQSGLILAQRRNGRWVHRHLTDETVNLRVPGRALHLYRGRLLFGSTAGLVEIGPDGVRTRLTPDGEGFGYVYSLHEGPDGELFIATLGNGLWRVRDDRTERVSGASLLPDSNVYCVVHDTEGRIIAANDGYLVRLDGRRPTILTHDGEAVAAWGLTFLPDGRLAVGSSAGLELRDPDTGARLAHIRHVGGDRTWEFTTSRSLQAGATRLDCGLAGGMGHIDLQALERIGTPPGPRLARIQVHHAEGAWVDGYFRLWKGAWRIEVSLATGFYLDERDLVMRYRLEGFDAHWSPPRPVGPITYTCLPRGRYRLQVRLSSGLAGEGPVEEVLPLRIF